MKRFQTRLDRVLGMLFLGAAVAYLIIFAVCFSELPLNIPPGFRRCCSTFTSSPFACFSCCCAAWSGRSGGCWCPWRRWWFPDLSGCV